MIALREEGKILLSTDSAFAGDINVFKKIWICSNTADVGRKFKREEWNRYWDSYPRDSSEKHPSMHSTHSLASKTTIDWDGFRRDEGCTLAREKKNDLAFCAHFSRNKNHILFAGRTLFCRFEHKSMHKRQVRSEKRGCKEASMDTM